MKTKVAGLTEKITKLNQTITTIRQAQRCPQPPPNPIIHASDWLIPAYKEDSKRIKDIVLGPPETLIITAAKVAKTYGLTVILINSIDSK